MIKCQFCDTTVNVTDWCPAGPICNACKKNLDNIRKYKFGIPAMRITKEMHDND